MSSVMIARPQRRSPATIVAIVLLLVAAGTLWAGGQHLFTGQMPAWFDAAHGWLTALTWGSLTALALSAAVLVGGAVLVVSALKPGQVSGLAIVPQAVHQSVGGADIVLSRRALARLCGARAAQVDGVDRVRVDATSRSVRLRIDSAAADLQAVRTEVTQSVQERLDALGFARTPAVSIRTRSTR